MQCICYDQVHNHGPQLLIVNNYTKLDHSFWSTLVHLKFQSEQDTFHGPQFLVHNFTLDRNKLTSYF